MRNLIIMGVVALVLCFLGGASDGLNQTLYAHYSAFKAKHPDISDSYWDPSVSWEQKYKRWPTDSSERFLFSKTLLVGFTDAYHLSRQAYGLLNGLGISLLTLASVLALSRSSLKPPLLAVIAEVILLCWVAKSLGFHLIYTLVYC